MLTTEEAEKRLEKLSVSHGTKNCISALTTLPENLAKLGLAALHLDIKGKPLKWQTAEAVVSQAGRDIDALSADDRRTLFNTMFPVVGAAVDSTWEMLKGMPYTAGYTRKAMRAPHDLSATLNQRMSWIHAVSVNLLAYPYDVAWFAAWAPYVERYSDGISLLLAGAINLGGMVGEQVFQIILDSARNEHEIGGMGNHVCRALLSANRPDGWEFMEKFLLAAQRQEGLRQSILEAIDLAHPEAFKRMVKVILDNNLARFSATVRAVNVWFGFQWDSVTAKTVNTVLETIHRFFDDPDACRAGREGDDYEAAYLAYWTMAFEDAPATVAPLAELLQSPVRERRFFAVYLLREIGLPQTTRALADALNDDDPHVALYAFNHLQDEAFDTAETAMILPDDMFTRLEELFHRLPSKKVELKPILWPWTGLEIDRRAVAGALVKNLGKEPATKLLPYLQNMEGWHRLEVVQSLLKIKKMDPLIRQTLFTLVGDSTVGVREAALKGIARSAPSVEEAKSLEKFLSRKTTEVRRGVLSVLLKQKDDACLASADRLLAGAANLRLGGLELLREMVGANRNVEACRNRAEHYVTKQKKLSEEEETHLQQIRGEEPPIAATLENALGLMDPSQRSAVVAPVSRRESLDVPAAFELLRSLDAFIHQHRDTPIVIEDEDSRIDELLGTINYRFPVPDDLDLNDVDDTATPFLDSEDGDPDDFDDDQDMDDEEIAPSMHEGETNSDDEEEEEKDRKPAVLLLPELWEQWWNALPTNARDPDGLELYGAIRILAQNDYIANEMKKNEAGKTMVTRIRGNNKPPKIRYEWVIKAVLQWMLRLHPPQVKPDIMLDLMESSFAVVPDSELRKKLKQNQPIYWRMPGSPVLDWMAPLNSVSKQFRHQWTSEHQGRLWRLLRWLDEPIPGYPRQRCDFKVLVQAYRVGAATEADLIDNILGPRANSEYYWQNAFTALSELTARKGHPLLQEIPRLAEIVENIRQRILEVELQRGDTPTAATKPAGALRSVWGQETLVKLLQALGKEKLTRSSGYQIGESKSDSFSVLIKNCFPLLTDSSTRFKELVAKSKISTDRMVELGVFAPQWTAYAEAALDWQGYVDGVWWLRAHTRDSSYGRDDESRLVKAAVRERTPLTTDELAEGAVDVLWFHKVYQQLGVERWAKIHEAAKYACEGTGHSRARLFADAMLGKLTRDELKKRALDKRYQDGIRALGLLPLPTGADRDADVLERYKIIQEFLRTSKQFGSQRRENEKRAAAIGLANLARTAGFPDSTRLEWAMEAEVVSDLASGSVSHTVENVTVTLSIDQTGEPDLTVAKNNKPLKNIPPAIKKNPQIATLLERKTEIKRQASRMRTSLEVAMCRGDVFSAEELTNLLKHPVLAPMLNRVILLGEGIFGYPVEGGKALRDASGKLEPIKKGEQLRIAHPYDLYKAGAWHHWQHDCFQNERVQPFKQVFRELYLLTEAEKLDKNISRRYAGHQVNPRQAMALFGQRNWVAQYDEGVRRTYHEAGISAWLTFLGSWTTPAEVEGLTLEGLQFARKGEWEPMGLDLVPPALFSETMRDLDLVVSVAHRGGVDPEASASTVEMRASLLRETCELFRLENVTIEKSHALIQGFLGQYSIHLGSAVVHKIPGGSLCIVPVHAQHRGRLFLPFADSDPRTAEVMSKVLLLARDKEIQDPTILEQLR